MIGERFDSWLRGNRVLVDALTASVLAVASVVPRDHLRPGQLGAGGRRTGGGQERHRG